VAARCGLPASAVVTGTSDELEKEMPGVAAGVRGQLGVVRARKATANVVG
jgi:hypothetical protein